MTTVLRTDDCLALMDALFAWRELCWGRYLLGSDERFRQMQRHRDVVSGDRAGRSLIP